MTRRVAAMVVYPLPSANAPFVEQCGNGSESGFVLEPYEYKYLRLSTDARPHRLTELCRCFPRKPAPKGWSARKGVVLDSQRLSAPLSVGANILARLRRRFAETGAALSDALRCLK